MPKIASADSALARICGWYVAAVLLPISIALAVPPGGAGITSVACRELSCRNYAGHSLQPALDDAKTGKAQRLFRRRVTAKQNAFVAVWTVDVRLALMQPLARVACRFHARLTRWTGA